MVENHAHSQPHTAVNTKSARTASAMLSRSAANGPGPVDRHLLSSFSNSNDYDSSLQRTRLQSNSTLGNSNNQDGSLTSSISTRGDLRSTSVGSRIGNESIVSGQQRNKPKPPLGIYIPSFTNSGSYYLPPLSKDNINTPTKSPLKRKPVPGSASTVGDEDERQRTPKASFSKPRNLSSNVLYPPRKSSLNSPLISPANRSATISTPGHPNLVGVELVFRDLDKYVTTLLASRYMKLGIGHELMYIRFQISAWKYTSCLFSSTYKRNCRLH
jgi:hypothetical protein